MEVTKMKVTELRDLAKQLSITGRWDMNKQQLIDAILAAQRCVQYTKTGTWNNTQAEQKDTTEDYLKRVQEGQLVAFKHEQKVMSGQFRGYVKNKYLIVTKHKTEFVVESDDILWVKTSGRWPKWIFNMFKGGSDNVTQKA